MRYGGYSGGRGERGRGAPASRGPSPAERRSRDAASVRDRGGEGEQQMVPSLSLAIARAIGANIGERVREGIASRIEAGGTPVREGGIIIGVETDGTYFGRPRAADVRTTGDGEGRATAPAAQMGAAAPQPEQPAAKTVRRSKLVQQIEEENRRRRLAGLRRLGSRTLLSGDRLSADTLGAA